MYDHHICYPYNTIKTKKEVSYCPIGFNCLTNLFYVISRTSDVSTPSIIHALHSPFK